MTAKPCAVWIQVLLQNGRLKMGHKQQPLRSKGEAGGAFIVISGIVRLTGQTADGTPLEEAYLAAGWYLFHPIKKLKPTNI